MYVGLIKESMYVGLISSLLLKLQTVWTVEEKRGNSEVWEGDVSFRRQQILNKSTRQREHSHITWRHRPQVQAKLYTLNNLTTTNELKTNAVLFIHTDFVWFQTFNLPSKEDLVTCCLLTLVGRPNPFNVQACRSRKTVTSLARRRVQHNQLTRGDRLLYQILSVSIVYPGSSIKYTHDLETVNDFSNSINNRIYCNKKKQ